MKKITEKEFRAEYAELKKKFKAVKAELRKISKELTPFRRRAEKLAKQTENSLYIEEPGVPIKPAFRKLDDMLDDVLGWTMARDVFLEATEAIP